LIHRGKYAMLPRSVPANIREGIEESPVRPDQACRFARGSAEEADEHLRANFADGRVPAAAYRRIHNRIALVANMLTTILNG
jgi:four helix bundle protein